MGIKTHSKIKFKKLLASTIVVAFLLSIPLQGYSQKFSEQEYRAVTDESEQIIKDLIKFLNLTDKSDNKPDEEFRSSFINLFSDSTAKIINFAFSRDSISDSIIQVNQYANYLLHYYDLVGLNPQTTFFDTKGQRLNHLSDLNINELNIRRYKGNHMLTVHFSITNFSASYPLSGQSSSESFQKIENGNKITDTATIDNNTQFYGNYGQISHAELKLSADIVFETLSFISLFPKWYIPFGKTLKIKPGTFKIRKIDFYKQTSNVDDETPTDEPKCPKEFDTSECENIESLVSKLIDDFIQYASISTDAGNNQPDTILSVRFIDLFSKSDTGQILSTFFFNESVIQSDIMTPDNFATSIKEQYKYTTLKKARNYERKIDYANINCEKFIVYHVTEKVAFQAQDNDGKWFNREQDEVELNFTVKVEFEKSFVINKLKQEILKIEPVIVNVGSSFSEVNCPPPKSILSFGANYLHKADWFEFSNDNRSNGFKHSQHFSSGFGLDMVYFTSINKNQSLGFGLGIQYLNHNAELQNMHYQFSEPSFNELGEFDKVVTATELFQSMEFKSLTVPVTIQYKYDLSPTLYLKLIAGLQLSINSDATISQNCGIINYKGLYDFEFDGEWISGYVLENIPAYGFDNYSAILVESDQNFELNSTTLGGSISIHLSKHLGDRFPAYLEIGPNFYYGFTPLFDKLEAKDNINLIGDAGINHNYFNRITKGNNYSAGFNVGLRFFIN